MTKHARKWKGIKQISYAVYMQGNGNGKAYSGERNMTILAGAKKKKLCYMQGHIGKARKQKQNLQRRRTIIFVIF